jgi:hypothetical protein
MLPLMVALLIHAAGWRLSWGILGMTIALVLLPSTHSLLKNFRNVEVRKEQLSGKTSAQELLRSAREWPPRHDRIMGRGLRGRIAGDHQGNRARLEEMLQELRGAVEAKADNTATVEADTSIAGLSRMG